MYLVVIILIPYEESVARNLLPSNIYEETLIYYEVGMGVVIVIESVVTARLLVGLKKEQGGYLIPHLATQVRTYIKIQ